MLILVRKEASDGADGRQTTSNNSPNLTGRTCRAQLSTIQFSLSTVMQMRCDMHLQIRSVSSPGSGSAPYFLVKNSLLSPAEHSTNKAPRRVQWLNDRNLHVGLGL